MTSPAKSRLLLVILLLGIFIYLGAKHMVTGYDHLLFLFGVFIHAWVGMRDIFMDYVHPTVIRLALHVAVILALLAYAAWAVQILWSVQ